MVKPLAAEPVRTLLTVFAVALGVAVVLAMDLAGDAATGSFHSSLETLSGEQNFEITATGGIPEDIVGKLYSQPYDWHITPRMEDYAVVTETKQTIPLVGLDLIAESNRLQLEKSEPSDNQSAGKITANAESFLRNLTSHNSVWVGESVGKHVGDKIQLLINDRAAEYVVRGTYSDANGGQTAIIMDIAAAQFALNRVGHVDRIYIRVPQTSSEAGFSVEEWQRRIQNILPDGIAVRAAGASTNENRKMLAAFRWNLRLLSYIALVVGAFLIYNTISVSVVRRRSEIGIARALGASRLQILAAFLGEALCIGVAGSLLGLPVGRWMADAAIKLMGATVNALYVTSRPGTIGFSLRSAALGLFVGAGITLLSAWSPARDAADVAPVQAMARGRREFEVRTKQTSSLC